MAGRMSKKTQIMLAIVVIAIGAPVGIAVSCDSSSPPDSPPQSQNATDFTLPTLTGANVTLSELGGTPVVLNFWTTTCTWCRKQLPYLESVAQQKTEEMKVIAIDVGQNASTVQNFFGDYEPTMIIALDSDGAVFTDYCLTYNNARGAVPFTLFVDSEGVIRYQRIGAFVSEAELWDALHSVFGVTVP